MENNYEEIRRECRNQLLEQIDYTKDMRDEEILDLIDDCVLRVGKTQKLSLQIKTVFKESSLPQSDNWMFWKNSWQTILLRKLWSMV